MEKDITEVRPRADYNDAERGFSLVLQRRLQEILDGSRNRLDLLRRYPEQPDRLGVIATPPDLPREQLRLPVVEALTWDVVEFVSSDDATGGPLTQFATSDGSIVEQQMFPTRYPHIVIERTDRYSGGSPSPVDITWSLRRVQNQRNETRLNRILDATALALDLLGAVRLPR